VTGLIFPPRADIENDDLALTDAAEQFVASNGFHSAALLEIGLCDLPDLGEPGLGQLSQCVEEQADLIVRQPVLDKEALLLGFDEPGGTQDPQVLGCVCYGYVSACSASAPTVRGSFLANSEFAVISIQFLGDIFVTRLASVSSWPGTLPGWSERNQ
jgi:hypothetical protein